MNDAVVGEAVNGDVTINFEVRGPADGRVLILVAGLGEQIGSVEFTSDHADRFVEEGFRRSPRQPRRGGLSTALEAAGSPDLDVLFTVLFGGKPVPVPYTFRDMADDVLTVADAIDAAEIHLVGASMGGWIVRWAAVRDPNRVKSLTVVMSGAGADIGDDGPQLDAGGGLDELISLSERRAPAEQIVFTVELWRADWGSAFPFDEAWVREHVTASFERSYRPDGVYRQIVAGLGTQGLWAAQRVHRGTDACHARH